MEIKVPSNTTLINDTNIHGTIKWSPDFVNKVNERYAKGGKLQTIIDATILAECSRYIPKETGMLEDSGILKTTIGSGLICWHTAYARYLYYGKLMIDPETKSSFARKGVKKVLTDNDLKYQNQRQAFWFEAWKADHLNDLIRRLQE